MSKTLGEIRARVDFEKESESDKLGEIKRKTAELINLVDSIVRGEGESKASEGSEQARLKLKAIDRYEEALLIAERAYKS